MKISSVQAKQGRPLIGVWRHPQLLGVLRPALRNSGPAHFGFSRHHASRAAARAPAAAISTQTTTISTSCDSMVNPAPAKVAADLPMSAQELEGVVQDAFESRGRVK